MMTCHPSYLPLELMASGALVISNRNPHTSWLLRDRENCLVSEPSPGAMAATIVEALTNNSLRETLALGGLKTIAAAHTNWASVAEHVFQVMHRATVAECAYSAR